MRLLPLPGRESRRDIGSGHVSSLLPVAEPSVASVLDELIVIADGFITTDRFRCEHENPFSALVLDQAAAKSGASM